jgi:hypothetical protein
MYIMSDIICVSLYSYTDLIARMAVIKHINNFQLPTSITFRMRNKIIRGAVSLYKKIICKEK